MNPQDFLPKPVIDVDDQTKTVAVTFGSKTEVLSFRTKTGKKAYLVAYGTNTSGSVNDITHELETNGGPCGQYGRGTFSYSDPTFLVWLPFPVALAENALVRYSATLATANANVTVRLVVYYTER